MDISLDPHWETFVGDLVSQGRFASVDDVMREGLRLVEQRETKLKALREELAAAIAEGGEITDEELEVSLNEKYEELKARGL